MRQEVKDAWVQALESGDYEQGTGALRTGDKYCCLGVLCDLAVKAGVAEWVESEVRDDLHRIQKVNGVPGSGSFLPKFVMEWAGVENTRSGSGDFNVTLSDDNYETHLASLNDQGRPFSYIASLIREQL